MGRINACRRLKPRNRFFQLSCRKKFKFTHVANNTMDLSLNLTKCFRFHFLDLKKSTLRKSILLYIILNNRNSERSPERSVYPPIIVDENIMMLWPKVTWRRLRLILQPFPPHTLQTNLNVRRIVDAVSIL